MNALPFEWTVIGAGPAGIAAIGKLLDQGIQPHDILWLDSAFQVGDLGRLWHSVSSNTTVQRFLDFLHAADSFQYKTAETTFSLHRLDPSETCTLSHVVEPLQWITHHLRQTVSARVALVQRLQLSEREWILQDETNRCYRSKRVILAIGSTPTTLTIPHLTTISLEDAIHRPSLSQLVEPNDAVAVFGSSHSAMIILEHLLALDLKKIVNVYRSPCRYAVAMGDYLLFDNTGLKGHAAEFARQCIDGTPPSHLIRCLHDDPHLSKHVSNCNKAIYATGFTRRHTLSIGQGEYNDYEPHTGIIGPGLFGLGIAYPEQATDQHGILESQVGLWKFMRYLTRILPIWMHYHT